jgi:hypothetical protein
MSTATCVTTGVCYQQIFEPGMKSNNHLHINPFHATNKMAHPGTPVTNALYNFIVFKNACEKLFYCLDFLI